MTAQEEISTISDVAYLLTRFRIAGNKGESEVKNAIISRLQELGLLDGEGIDPAQQQNLKDELEQFN
jgi:hypothetical protein